MAPLYCTVQYSTLYCTAQQALLLYRKHDYCTLGDVCCLVSVFRMAIVLYCTAGGMCPCVL